MELGTGTVEGLELKAFWKGKRVLVTGHTGFKGTWLTLWLERLGAEVCGIALDLDQSPSIYTLAGPWDGRRHHAVDIRDAQQLQRRVKDFAPEIVLHLAAQALVRRSYRQPAETYAVNVTGTVNLLDAVLAAGPVKTVLVITTDKVYAETGTGVPYREGDALGGKDPYSNSKACVELLCRSYRQSFMAGAGIGLATARSGNVIGGGDWSEDRLVPDMVRAFCAGEAVSLRYPDATRPWQHVLEPLSGYLMFAQALHEDPAAQLDALNFGPDPNNVATVSQLAEELARVWDAGDGWRRAEGVHPPEAAQLTLDSTLAATTIGWRPRLDLRRTVDWTCAWYKAWRAGADMRAFTLGQISEYEGLLA